MTDGKARPTGPSAASPRSMRAQACSTDCGVEGTGVGTTCSGVTVRPCSTSTSAALMEEPPTSNPSTVRVMHPPSCAIQKLRLLQLAGAPPIATLQPQCRADDPRRHQRDQQRREGVHVRADTETHLGKYYHRQGTR